MTQFLRGQFILFSYDKKQLIAYPPKKNDTSYTIPEGVESLASHSFSYCNASEIIIPASVSDIDYSFALSRNLENIKVSADNENYTDINGVLYNKDMTEIIKYPSTLTEESFTVPDTVKTIGKYAFYDTDLREIKIPETLETIKDYAFSRSHLKEIEIPDTCTNIGQNAFYNIYYLEKAVIPKSVKSIGTDCFNKCSKLTIYGYTGSSAEKYAVENDIPFIALYESEVNENIIQSGVCGEEVTWRLNDEGTLTISGSGKMYDYLGYDSVPWRDWQDSIFKVVVDDGVENIGDYSFYSFHELKELSISNTVKTIGSYSFYWCSCLEKVIIPDSVECIRSSAFSSCMRLKEVEYPETLTKISNNIFKDTSWLSSYYENKENKFLIINGNLLDGHKVSGEVVIPDGVVNIADEAFSNMNNIESVAMPESLISIGKNAFNGCSKLSEVNFNDNIEAIRGNAFNNTQWFKDRKSEDTYVIVKNVLLNASGAEGDVVIPENITYISDEAFDRCKGITSVSIPDGVTYIGDSAFYWCENIKEITLPKELRTIGQSAFNNCFALSEINIPDKVTYIGPTAFFQCSRIENLDLPESLETIGDDAFGVCNGLKELYIPKNVKEIGNNIAAQASDLEKITVDEENNYYCDIDGVLYNKKKTHIIAYPGNKADESYTLPDSVTDIRPSAFKATKVKELNIPAGVKYLWKEAFSYAYSIRNYNVSSENPDFCDIDGVLCDKSKTVLIQYPIGREDTSYTIPDGIKNIGKYAFFVSKLQSMTLPESLEKIDDYGFANSAFTEVEIPDGCTYISTLAFMNNQSLEKIIIPRSVSRIISNAFQGSRKVTIYGYKDSEAETFANSEKIHFVDIDASEKELTGDLSNDGIVNSEDLIFLVNVLLASNGEMTEDEYNACDLNGDGVVNIIDLIYLKQLLLSE